MRKLTRTRARRERRRSRRRVFRILMWIGTTLTGLAVIFVIAAVILVRRPFPDVRGTVTLSGLNAPVEILRDEQGVPHIWGGTREDVYFAQGYVHAQDRFWQMEFSRRVGQGRLSEILGAGLVDSDRYLRTLGFYKVAQAEYRAMPQPYKRYLDAYTAGVNAYITDRDPGQLGLEFTLLGLTGVDLNVEAWEPAHSLTWGKVMAETLSAGFGTELGNIRYRRFGGGELHELMRPPFREEFPYIASVEELTRSRERLGLGALTTGTAAQGETASAARKPELGAHPTVGGLGIGSNNWVLAGSRTETGLPLLANDMHLGVQMPSIWYEVGLHVDPERGPADEALHLRGYSFPGVLGVVAGQNGEIAWGITNLPGDAKDAHRLEIHPEDVDRYRLDGEWRDMTVRRELIRIAGEERPAEHQVRETVYGPVITDLPQLDEWFSYEIENDEADAPVRLYELALRWSALTTENLVGALLDLNEASDYREFREALSRWGSPGQNFVYADAEGTIAYQATGVFPDPSMDTGRLPAQAWDVPTPAGDGPAGPLPFDDLPAVVNPEKGYIVTANQPVVPPEHPVSLGREAFAPGRRAARIAERIEAIDGAADIPEMQAIHADVYSIAAAELTPHLTRIDPAAAMEAWERFRVSRGIPENHEGSDAEEEEAELRRRVAELLPPAIEALDAWDRRMGVESAGAAVYAFVFHALVDHVLRDEVPAQEWPLASPGRAQSLFYPLLQDYDAPAWDDALTPEVEEAPEILARALAVGVRELADAQGDDPTQWAWGESHRISFENQSLGQSGIGIVEAIFNRGPFPVPGGPTTVNPAMWSYDEAFDVTAIPSQRAVYDLADPSRSVFTHTTGQSGHPFHRHYDDMIEQWRKVEYHRANWSYREAREAAGGRRLVLEPAP